MRRSRLTLPPPQDLERFFVFRRLVAGEGHFDIELDQRHALVHARLVDHGKAIVANDPATGKQVLLNYAATTKTVGGVVGVFDARTTGFVSVADPGGSTPPGGRAASPLPVFMPVSLIAVSIK